MVPQVWRGEVKNLEVEFLQDLPVVYVCVCVFCVCVCVCV